MLPGSCQSTAADLSPCDFFFFFDLALEKTWREKTVMMATLVSKTSQRFLKCVCTVRTPIREEKSGLSAEARGNDCPHSNKHSGLIYVWEGTTRKLLEECKRAPPASEYQLQLGLVRENTRLKSVL